jgi:dimethylargininase
MLIAITREISPRFNECELTHLERQPIDLNLAVQQHHQYEDALSSLGCAIYRLPAEPDLPDSVFVEDCALVLDEAAVITRPGSDSRKPELDSVAAALRPYRSLHFIELPGSMDGGDILRIGKTIYVGLSSRSNQNAVDQLQASVRRYGYTVIGVSVRGCLHLKSAVTLVSPDALLLNPHWVDATFFGMDYIEVHPAEPNAANAVLIQGKVIYPSSFPGTCQRLEAHSIPLVLVPATEVAKAEGAVTCCSLVFAI